MGKNTPQERASKWQTRFTRCETNQAQLFSKASKHFDILYAVQNTHNVAPWRAKIYLPILGSKAWDLVARLSGVLPYFRSNIKVDELEYNLQTDKMEIDAETGLS